MNGGACHRAGSRRAVERPLASQERLTAMRSFPLPTQGGLNLGEGTIGNLATTHVGHVAASGRGGAVESSAGHERDTRERGRRRWRRARQGRRRSSSELLSFMIKAPSRNIKRPYQNHSINASFRSRATTHDRDWPRVGAVGHGRVGSAATRDVATWAKGDGGRLLPGHVDLPESHLRFSRSVLTSHDVMRAQVVPQRIHMRHECLIH